MAIRLLLALDEKQCRQIVVDVFCLGINVRYIYVLWMWQHLWCDYKR